MSEISNSLFEKIMNWVDSWELWRMVHDEILISELCVEIEYKDG